MNNILYILRYFNNLKFRVAAKRPKPILWKESRLRESETYTDGSSNPQVGDNRNRFLQQTLRWCHSRGSEVTAAMKAAKRFTREKFVQLY